MDLPDKKILAEMFKEAASTGDAQIIGLAESVIESAVQAEGAILRFEATEGGLSQMMRERRGK